MADLTLSLDDRLLQQAREAAARDHTSVNALVRDYLARHVDARRRRLETLDALDAPAERGISRSSGKGWTRVVARFDALIVEAAIRGRCETLYSEDLDRERRFGPTTVINPFR